MSEYPPPLMSPYSVEDSDTVPSFTSPSSVSTVRPQHVDELETEADTSGETICLIGGHGPTGQQFCRKALDAGYKIRALQSSVNSNVWESLMEASNYNDAFTVIKGGLNEVEALEEALEGAIYVVCLLGDAVTKQDYESGMIVQHMETVYPLMKESYVRVFLYQASSLSVDINGSAPVMANVMKHIRTFFNRGTLQADHDRTVRYIGEYTEDWFKFIVTRPGLIRDGASRKRLAASKSQPGPIPIMAVDLAEFTLNALKNEKLHNKCPYVVGDGF